MLTLVADRHRRQILHYMIENGGTVFERDELIAFLGDQTATPQQHLNDTLAVDLHHIHLPRLDEAGVIEYNSHDGTIQYHHVEQIKQLLAFIEAELV